jgi:hypothetical protein
MADDSKKIKAAARLRARKIASDKKGAGPEIQSVRETGRRIKQLGEQTQSQRTRSEMQKIATEEGLDMQELSSEQFKDLVTRASARLKEGGRDIRPEAKKEAVDIQINLLEVGKERRGREGRRDKQVEESERKRRQERAIRNLRLKKEVKQRRP